MLEASYWRKLEDDDFIFLRVSGEFIPYNTALRSLKRGLALCDLDINLEGVGTHIFRKSLINNANLSSAQDVLTLLNQVGHSDINITTDFYLDVSKKSKAIDNSWI